MKYLLIIVASLGLSGCATTNQMSDNGSPIISEILNKKVDDVRSKLVLKLSTSDNPWSIKSESQTSLLVTRPCGSSFSCNMLQLAVGNSYSTPVQFDMGFTLVQDNQNVKVIVTGIKYWSQMPGGQINTQEMSRTSGAWSKTRESMSKFEAEMNADVKASN